MRAYLPTAVLATGMADLQLAGQTDLPALASTTPTAAMAMELTSRQIQGCALLHHVDVDVCCAWRTATGVGRQIYLGQIVWGCGGPNFQPWNASCLGNGWNAAPMRDYGSSTTLEIATQEHVSFAFKTLLAQLKRRALPEPDFPEATTALFVTWKTSPRTRADHARLRGCIGILEPRQLHKALRDYTLNSALHDRRFSPIQLGEVRCLHDAALGLWAQLLTDTAVLISHAAGAQPAVHGE